MLFLGLELEVFESVYEPAEDSFLLAGHAAGVAKGLGEGGRILDVGCGCGIAALSCAAANPGCRVTGVDLNPDAVGNSRLNAKSNGVKNAEFFESDLFSNVGKKFDLVLFNPPYLPTSKEERVQGKLNLAFDGGKDGRGVTDRFLAQFSHFLKKRGVLLMVESSLAGIGKTVEKLEKGGFGVEIMEEEKFFFEKIALLRAQRTM